MSLQSGSYSFKPHEMPIMAGTPASPDHPPRRRLAYLVIGTLLSLVSGFQNGVLSAVLPQLRGDLALDLQQGGWIQAAYFMSYACMSVLFFKIRQAYGVQRFVRITLLPCSPPTSRSSCTTATRWNCSRAWRQASPPAACWCCRCTT